MVDRQESEPIEAQTIGFRHVTDKLAFLGLALVMVNGENYGIGLKKNKKKILKRHSELNS